MRASAWSLSLLVALTVLSGCLGAGGDPGADEEDPPAASPTVAPTQAPGQGTPGATPPPSGGGPSNGTGGNTSGGPGNETGNGTTPGGLAGPVWPDINEARVRPGVQIVIEGSQCTSNFLFRSPLNGTVYIGLAAHCAYGASPGAVATVRDLVGAEAFSGPVAYSSWWDIGFETPPDASGGPSEVHPHDFALVAIPPADLGIVHPAVLHYGGPTALADFSSVAQADAVLVFGNTGLRPGPQQLDWQEGYVLSKGSEEFQGSVGHFVRAVVALPPLPGDSGSGLMTKDGKALGALSTINAGVSTSTLSPVYWEYSSVPHALEHLAARGWPLEVVTWDLLDDGNLPG